MFKFFDAFRKRPPCPSYQELLDNRWEQSRNIADLRDRLDAATRREEELSKDVQHENSRRKAVEQDFHHHGVTIGRLQKRISQLDQQLIEKGDRVTELSHKVSHLDHQLVKKTEECIRQQHHIEGMTRTIHESAKTEGRLSRKLHQLRKLLDEIRAAHHVAKQEMLIIGDSVEVVENEHFAVEKALDKAEKV